MAYLSHKGYDYDVFISYAHIDNQPINNIEWITEFEKNLQAKLEVISGRDNIKLWRDTTIDHNEVFNTRIAKGLETSALFIACNSRSYMNRPYCLKEISYFRKAINEISDPYGLLFNNVKARIFNVLLSDIPHQEWVSALRYKNKDNTGYELFNGNLPLRPNSAKYDDQITTLATDIWEMLKDIGKPNSERKKVFFAEVPKSLGRYSEQIQDQLNERTRVNPDEKTEMPRFERKHQEKVTELIKNSVCSSIHLFDIEEGTNGNNRTFEDTQNYYSIGQLNAVLQTDTPQLVLYNSLENLSVLQTPPTLPKNIIEDNIVKLITSIRSENFKKTNLEIFRSTPSDMAREITIWLDKYLQPKVDENYWLIDTDASDFENEDIIKLELSNLGQETKPMAGFSETLKTVKHYILVIYKRPISSIDRIGEVYKIKEQMQLGSKLGIYIAPNAKDLDNDQVEIIKACMGDFIVYDSTNKYNINNNIDGLSNFITKLS